MHDAAGRLTTPRIVNWRCRDAAGLAGAAASRPRAVALDTLRGFVTGLVVLHHAVLAYCVFGRFDPKHYLWSSAPIVDGARWVGFDVVVLFNDSFFMPLMFLLSGLFVWPSLLRKGAAAYLRDRLLRLGVPFAVSVLLLVPLAYYPSFRMTGDDTGYVRFWARMVLDGPWPSGPAWFIGALLVCDLAAALAGRLALARRPARSGPDGPDRQGAWAAPAVFGVLVLASALGFLPLLAAFGPARWVGVGPLAIQASRIGLYAVYFGAGIAIGRRGTAGGLLAPRGGLQRGWGRWVALAGLLFLPVLGVQAARLGEGRALPPIGWTGLYGLAFAPFCAAASLAAVAVFLRFARHSGAAWASLSRNAYGIYLLHYPVVVWLQFALLGQRLGAVPKAAVTFGGSLVLSWGAASVLRRVPGASRVV